MLASRQKRALLIASVVAVLLGLGGYVAYQNYVAPDRFLIAMNPAGPGRLLVEYRMAYDRAEPYFRVGLLDTAQGAMIWERALPEGVHRGASHGDMTVDVASGKVVLRGDQSETTARYTALNLEDGELAWTQDIDHKGGSVLLNRGPTIVDGLLLVPNALEGLTALEIDSGEAR